MPADATWDCYLSARAMALRSCAEADVAATAIARAEARLQTYLTITREQARIQARRSFLYTGDAAFHDQLLASGRMDFLRAAVEHTIASDLPLAQAGGRGALIVTLHYGPATAILPLWLAMASGRGTIGEVGVIENSRRDPNVMLSPRRHAELGASGFPFADLDLATLGECGALRRALTILRNGGVVLIFADGQLPQPDAKRTLTCRLGRRSLVLPHGAAWLARTADVPLIPLLLRPQAERNRIVWLSPFAPFQAQAGVQALLDAAMTVDPAPWWRWSCSADHL